MADDTKFNVGDVVQLRSGGPVMVVEWGGPDSEEFDCRWWNEATATFESTRFRPEVLDGLTEDE